MSAPSFSLAGVISVTLSRSYILPWSRPVRPRQKVGRSETGHFQVATMGDEDEVFPLQFRGLTATDRATLLAFFQHAQINWRAHTFTYTDHESTATTVRLLDADFDMPMTASGLYDVDITLIKEPS